MKRNQANIMTSIFELNTLVYTSNRNGEAQLKMNEDTTVWSSVSPHKECRCRLLAIQTANGTAIHLVN